MSTNASGRNVTRYGIETQQCKNTTGILNTNSSIKHKPLYRSKSLSSINTTNRDSYKVVDKTNVSHVNKSVNKPVNKSIIRPVSKPMNKPVSKPISKLMNKSVNDPVNGSTTRTINDPIVRSMVRRAQPSIVKCTQPSMVKCTQPSMVKCTTKFTHSDNIKTHNIDVDNVPHKKTIKACSNIVRHIKTDREINTIKTNNRINAEEIDNDIGCILEKLCELSNSNNATVLKEFVHVIYKNTHCIGGLHNGILYKELPNTWSRRKEKYTEEENKYCCEGEAYNDCTISNKINKPVKGEVKLIWRFNKNKKDSTVNFDVDKDVHILLSRPSLLGYMKTLSQKCDDVFYKGKITIISTSHGGEDHRGSNHCLIDLPSISNITLINPTFNEFVETLYLSKENKFDKWYEMYTDCNIRTTNNNDITLTLNYDYGS